MHLMGIRKPRVHVNTVQGQYCVANGFFVDYVTDYFSGKQVGRLDFFNPAVRKWYWESFAVQENSYAKGISGYWNDEADEYGGNLMFMQMQRSQYEGQRSFNNNRVWSINRNFYTGAQRYAYALWSGDIPTGFPAMADQRLYMLSSIVLGVSSWGMDIGGFQNTPDPENYYRWVQFGAFVPVFRVHGSYNQEREPWYFGSDAESIATKYIRLRYQLMPYIYAAAWENHLTGVSIARPLIFEYPDDPAVPNLSSEWMFGNSLLVSPVIQSGATSQTVYLPKGMWYDFASGKSYAGPWMFSAPVTSVDIPIFVKGGALIPESLPAQYVDDPAAQNAVVLSSYPGGTGSCVVYDDDGKTYNYEQGVYRTTAISHDRNTSRAVIAIGAANGSYETAKRDWLAELNWVALPPDSVVLDGNLIARLSIDSVKNLSFAGWALDQGSQQAIARFPDDRSAHTLTVYFNSNSSAVPSEGTLVPKEFRLEQNYPNPFNPSTRIQYSLPVKSQVRVEVFNTLGQCIVTLENGEQNAGYQSVEWNTNVASGIYIYRMDASAVNDPTKRFIDTKKMLLLR
jgi:alpha-glucosidase (family GH31 glycosyl hydrolase)